MHSLVYVVTKEEPTEEIIFNHLKKFYCENEENYTFKDETEEKLQDWNSDKKYNVYPSDKNSFGYEFYWKSDFSSEIEGKVLEKKTLKEIYKTLEVFVEDCVILPDGRIGRYCNQESQWDWYIIGGRWENFLINNKNEEGNTFKKSDISHELFKESTIKECEEEWNTVKYLKDQYITYENYLNLCLTMMPFVFVINEQWISKENIQDKHFHLLKTGLNEDRNEYHKLVNNEWEEIAKKIWDDIPDNYYITVVDCHY